MGLQDRRTNMKILLVDLGDWDLMVESIGGNDSSQNKK